MALQGRVLDLRRSREVLEEEASRLREALARVRQELAEEERRVQGLLVQARVLEGQKGQLAEGLARLSQGLYLGEVRLGPEEGPVALEEAARRRALLLGFKGVRLLGGAKGPGLAVLEGAGYEDGVLLVRARFYPEKRLWPAGEVLASATFLNTGEPRARAVLLEVGERVRKRLLEEGVPPEYARFPTETDLAQGLLLLRGRSGVVRVGVVALREVWTVEPPLLAFRLLGGLRARRYRSRPARSGRTATSFQPFSRSSRARRWTFSGASSRRRYPPGFRDRRASSARGRATERPSGPA